MLGLSRDGGFVGLGRADEVGMECYFWRRFPLRRGCLGWIRWMRRGRESEVEWRMINVDSSAKSRIKVVVQF
jgi:hypothetical protein